MKLFLFNYIFSFLYNFSSIVFICVFHENIPTNECIFKIFFQVLIVWYRVSIQHFLVYIMKAITNIINAMQMTMG